jgi:hypothetical protein
MRGTNLESSQVVLSSTALSMLAAVLAVERNRVTGGKVGSRGTVVVVSHHDERGCIRLTNKCTI